MHHGTRPHLQTCSLSLSLACPFFLLDSSGPGTCWACGVPPQPNQASRTNQSLVFLARPPAPSRYCCSHPSSMRWKGKGWPCGSFVSNTRLGQPPPHTLYTVVQSRLPSHHPPDNNAANINTRHPPQPTSQGHFRNTKHSRSLASFVVRYSTHRIHSFIHSCPHSLNPPRRHSLFRLPDELDLVVFILRFSATSSTPPQQTTNLNLTVSLSTTNQPS